ncbi:type II secretion system protein [Phorcysia thermohydrogeniphila]|uniref:Prepilin-type N-terminal cleavage/methylation domain-containing protein n=1 Tax=Phorcysia thermohydrogeniphila TaxID=936138 RepID=A0A4R1G5Y7_9BACT|nr:prepilin-type N-terminal cleavage/methylation domain-containing protein [Phorcysia thermohydrogeniphila]TCK02878.1 prepilin-type N-terminal cleavage/methylation domain-containing protein [Phorcysia thermohydrogeniphila]
MKRAFTLLELVIVLVIISLVSIVTLPAFVNRGSNSLEGFENQIKSVMGSLFSFSSTPEVCIDFKNSTVEVSGDKVPFPDGFELTSFVSPGKIVSSHSVSKYCFSGNTPTVFGLIAKGDSVYYTVMVFIPSGETHIMQLNEAEAETFKDKILKGRIAEWFSFYSS